MSLSRRRLMNLGLASAGVPVLGKLLGVTAFAQDFGPGAGKLGVVGGRDEKALFPGPGLPGGGQTEIRMVQSIYTSDPDELEVAFRMKPYDHESWMGEWARVAERNEEDARGLQLEVVDGDRRGAARAVRRDDRRRPVRRLGDVDALEAEV